MIWQDSCGTWARQADDRAQEGGLVQKRAQGGLFEVWSKVFVSGSFRSLIRFKFVVVGDFLLLLEGRPTSE